MTEPDSAPAIGAPADDQLEWDSARYGTFAEYATPDDTVSTMSADEYLAGGR